VAPDGREPVLRFPFRVITPFARRFGGKMQKKARRHRGTKARSNEGQVGRPVWGPPAMPAARGRGPLRVSRYGARPLLRPREGAGRYGSAGMGPGRYS
jgi:hypothetical protein